MSTTLTVPPRYNLTYLLTTRLSGTYLADVVISISLEGDRDALYEERTEALTGGTSQLNVDTVVRQTSLLVPPGYTGIDTHTIHTHTQR